MLQNPSLFFTDGVRKIDFILAWDESIPSNNNEQSKRKRQVFEHNLEEEGLELEYVDSQGAALHFIKVHAPDEILRRYAEILKLRMPMKIVRSILHLSIFDLNASCFHLLYCCVFLLSIAD